jgi:hypothetical protein
MKIQLVAFRQCFVWLGAGWFAFKSNLGAWLVLSILFLITLMLLGILPFVGILFVALFMPFLLTGLLVSAHRSLVGSLARVEDMLMGFNDDRLRRPLLQLGSFMALGTLLIFIALYPLSLEALKATYTAQSDTHLAATLAAMEQSSPVSLLLQMGVIALVLMAFFYATPLVLFEDQAPLDAVTNSLLACLKNIIPLTLFGIMVLILGFVASFAFGLGYLVLIPVLASANYASFRDTFDPVEPPEDEPPNNTRKMPRARSSA